MVSVLWMLLLVSSLAAASLYVARSNAMIIHREPEFARAEAAADAAINRTIAALSDVQASRHPTVDGSLQPWKFDGIPMQISISNDDGRIDVNSADDLLLTAFLRSNGIDEKSAETMLDDLRAWQHVDRILHFPATVAASSSVPGGSANSGNRALNSIDELRQIPSWYVHGAACWEDSLTVYSGLSSVNESDAPPAVLAALRWAQDNRLGDRDWGGAGSQAQSVAGVRSYIGDVLRIRVAAVLGEVKTRTEWVGRLTGDSRHPALTMDWARTADETLQCLEHEPTTSAADQ